MLENKLTWYGIATGDAKERRILTLIDSDVFGWLRVEDVGRHWNENTKFIVQRNIYCVWVHMRL